MSMSVRLSVCLSVCLFAELENHAAQLRQIFMHVASTLARSLWYVMYFRFCGWRHFSHNGCMTHHVYCYAAWQAQQLRFQPTVAQQ